ncbi:MAG: FAD-dependent oxidoreductase [Leptospiraceae bacterium]|nr:FAD-dependent oxidoreductase [Leptospiraceae bacterium]
MKINRSDFLKTLSLLSLASITKKVQSEGNLSPKNNSPKQKEKSSAAIVGGGLSGLYSAYLLNRVGMKTTIIEGGNRFGGRIFSYREDANFIGELGGEWISTGHRNLLGLIKELELTTVSHNVQKEIVYGADKKPHEFSQDSKAILKKIFGMHRNMPIRQKQGLDKADIYNYLKYQGVKSGDLGYLEMKYRTRYGESIRNLSADRSLADFVNFEFDPETVFRVRGGNESIIEKLVAKLDNSEKILNDPVTEIDQSGGNVKVTTKSGRIIESDICIISIPPALISEIKWTPDIPKEKKLASILVKGGRATKLLIQTKGKNLGDGEIYYMNAPVQKVYFAEADSKEINLLNGLSVGDFSEIFSEDSQEYFKELITLSMRRYSLEEAFEIEKVNLKVWQNEPLIRGAFSVFPPGSFDARENLQKPFNRVFFAGESLSPNSGSMNSAVASAIQAVNQI